MSQPTALGRLRGREVLWVASSGGHVVEATLVDEVLGTARSSCWVVPDTQQTRGLLAGRRAVFVPYVGPRDVRGAGRAWWQARDHLRNTDVAACLSTGAAICVPFFMQARLRGVPSFYVESLTRTTGPSLTGKIARALPGVTCMTQHDDWSGDGWQTFEGPLGTFSALESARSRASLRLFVTLGTVRGFSFDRAIDAVLAVLQPGDEVIWQLGTIGERALPGTVHDVLGFAAMEQEMRNADVVICHAGVGSVLDALRLSKFPVLLVREPDFAEHVDNHQAQFAELCEKLNVAVRLDLGHPSRNTVVAAANTEVHRIATSL